MATKNAGKDQVQGQGTGRPAVTVTMTQDKVTKNAVRFQEDHANETEQDRIGQLYVQKSTFGAMGLTELPQRISVTLDTNL